MAPSDGTFGRAHSTTRLDLNLSVQAATHSPPIRRYSKLSLGRKRLRPAIDEQDNVKKYENAPAPKKPRQDNESTMNGHNHHKILDSGRYSASSNGAKSASSTNTSIASLCNLGNTCFLNSVLYTLRFTPGFLHNLHHLVTDLGLASSTTDKKDKRNRNNGGGGNPSGSTNSNGDVETE